MADTGNHAHTVECRVGNVDYASGDASSPQGLQGRKHRFRVFAGLRDDPFFNNVKGTRAFTMPHDGTWLLNVIWTTPLPRSRETDF
jgi:hypothetical protein